jgi:hypothetical protein
MPESRTMAKFGQRPINDAVEYKRRTSGEFYFDGESRIDRRPYGRIERFVDPVGNVITLQLSTPGDPKAVEVAMRIRNEKHMDGWVEHAKCPLRHGIDAMTPALEREFKKMPASIRLRCENDPKVMERVNGELHAKEACAHIEWLIADRRKREAVQNEKRNAARIREENIKKEASELQAAQLEMVKEQIEERRARKGKKAPTE